MSEKSAVNIGLRLADGSFYPMFDEEFRGTKRVVLTTVHDNQTSVQIDIYKGDPETQKLIPISDWRGVPEK